jgi:hypothetical protein
MSTYSKSTRLTAVFLAAGFIIAGLLLSIGWVQASDTAAPSQTTAAAGTAFTYQGRLFYNGTAINGPCNLTFRLYDADSFGTQIGSNISITGVSVDDGYFYVDLDFGSGAFTGDARFLQITINSCPNGASNATLDPLIELKPAPYAMYANSAQSLSINNTPALRLQATTSTPNLIGGYSGNIIATGVVGAVIGGGGNSSWHNLITDNYGTIGGGRTNRVGNNDGSANNAENATVAGGVSNTASGTDAAVGGGYFNTASGANAAVAGGNANVASGWYAAIPGGQANIAAGQNSLAAGAGAQAMHSGAFVWDGDDSFDTLSSSWDGQFIVRAPSGIWFGNTTGNITPTISALIDTSTGAYLSYGGTWTNNSDRSLKENFAAVDPQTVLEAVAEMPVTVWNYRSEEASVRHMGPMAQEFYAAFGLGEDDKHISTTDADGVSLAAIQALYAHTQDLQTENAALQEENAAMQAQIDALDARLAALETRPVSAPGGASIPLWAGLALVGLGLVWVFRFRRRIK